MNWRTWVYPNLCNVLPATSVFAGGALTEVPEVRPFFVYRIQAKNAALRDDQVDVAHVCNLEVWVYDNPGSYDAIEALIEGVKTELVGQVASEGAIACSWQGDSGELADDELKAIMKISNYRLVGGGAV